MHLSRAIGACLLALTSLSAAHPKKPVPRPVWPSKPAVKNDAQHRGRWSRGYDIDTNWDVDWPKTGKTVTYNFEVTNTTCAPDGVEVQTCMLVNGQFPGPTIEANWGDNIVVNLKNSLQWNGTGIHWHGLRQYQTNVEDGVPGITECPLAPGDSMTYKLRATQYGTSWYHSHGIDVPTEHLITNTILINGTNKDAQNMTGSWATTPGLIPGKKYLLRPINAHRHCDLCRCAGTDVQAFRVSLDNHSLTIIANDFVPVEPLAVDHLILAIGQRYDVIFTANQKPGNYWFCAFAETACFGSSINSALSIFNYGGVELSTPNSTAYTMPSDCMEPWPLQPLNAETLPKSKFLSSVVNLEVSDTTSTDVDDGGLVLWRVNGSSMRVDFEKPVLMDLMNGKTDFASAQNLIELPREGDWSFWVIQEADGAATFPPIPHPIHLHGHDMYILGQKENAIFDKNKDIDILDFTNPPRRDVGMLPSGGWVVIAFKKDNPGAWLLHCHIAVHVSEGLGLQFLESKHKIPSPGPAWKRTCKNWRRYSEGNNPYTDVYSPHAPWNVSKSGL
ncbi:hypothetical protein N7457_003506 [Penicillium paradoxum]|uniref:uncharacterized protein n=1 Tax=Penicillium paradoxum TaxID=176176 RepID=UPI002547FB5A|nr:uncharacterized protein N7457_003506 [Penicillium paradoxum]KAJ5788516.1 hypothetical protein N7457_003506 [Penicillium paradoxum]